MGFVKLLALKCICIVFLVFHGENEQNEYCLIILSFTNIVSILKVSKNVSGLINIFL